VHFNNTDSPREVLPSVASKTEVMACPLSTEVPATIPDSVDAVAGTQFGFRARDCTPRPPRRSRKKVERRAMVKRVDQPQPKSALYEGSPTV